MDPGDIEGRIVANKYAVLSVLGQGAMGVVYRAKQIALDKIVALKVLSRELRDDPEFVQRFHTEARAASRLDHPHSTRVLDFGEDADGLLYIAMELLQGRTLGDVLQKDFPLAPVRTAHILSRILSAVGAAHALKILHRDLKPENIVILEGRDDEDRRIDVVKVCDFGIAKLESETPEQRSSIAPSDRPVARRATMAGVIVGTPQYMSPEQARGQDLDVRSDLYALGVVLFEMLTRRTPFEDGTPAEVLHNHVFSAPPRPSSIEPGVDPALEAICMRALQKVPAHRFASAREMRMALRSLTEQGNVDVTPAPSQPRAFDASAPTVSAEPVAVAVPRRPRRRALWLLPFVAVCVVAAGAWQLSSRRFAQTPVAAAALTRPAVQRTFDAPLSTVRVASTAPATTQEAVATPHVRTVRPVAHKIPAPTASSTDDTSVSVEAMVTSAMPPPVVTTTVQTITAPANTLAAAPVVVPGRARVDVGTIRADRIDPASVASALRHVDFTTCYRDSLTAGSDAEGDATLTVDMDAEGVTRADVIGGRFPAALRQCITQRVLTVRVPNVDTGDASAKVTLRFSAR